MKAVNIGAQMGPDYRIELGEKEITDSFRSRLISLEISDKRGLEVDTFKLVLDDSDGNIMIPERGQVLNISIGWQGETLFQKGTFTIGGVNHSGSPDTLTLTGFSTDLSNVVKQNRSESYDGVTLGDIVRRIARRNGLQPSLSKELAAITVDHFDQTNESDLQFISRLAKRYGAIASIKSGMLLLLKPGNGTTASGKPLPRATIRRREGDRHDFAYIGDANYIGAKARWLRLDKAGMGCVMLEAENLPETQGKRYLVLPDPYKSEEEAKQALLSEWEKIQRSSATLTFMLAMGRPELIPEMRVDVEGFKSLIDNAQWFITNVDHAMSADGGFTSKVTLQILMQVKTRTVECELSKSEK